MALFGKKNANYISAKETKRISKENRKITNEIEKKEKQKEYSGVRVYHYHEESGNVVVVYNVHTYFFTDIGTVKAVDGVSFEILRENSWCCWRIRLWKDNMWKNSSWSV